MRFKDEKVVGYILLAVGVLMIFFSVYSMFVVFTGASAPPSLFNFSDVSLSVPQPEGGSETMQIVSGQDMNRMADMGTWYMLMFFVVYAGGKVASLGVNLLKEIRVEVKQ